MFKSKNPFLSRIMGKIRAERPYFNSEEQYSTRIERVRGGNYVEIWFQTRGCSWDAKGGCTMCNYGHGASLSASEARNALQKAFAELKEPCLELLVSPSGSMFDEQEVSKEVRQAAYDEMRKFGAKKILVETRSEFVTDLVLDEYRAAFPNTQLAIEMGVESSSPWIQKFCINKNGDNETFVSVVKAAQKRNIECYANISLGTAFLSPLEGIMDALRTIDWAFQAGSTSVVVFPLHVKPYTLLDVLYQCGNYQSPSLWSLIEILKRRSHLADRIEVSWYKSYYDSSHKVRKSPSTCPKCVAGVVACLDEYRALQDVSVFETLQKQKCDCYQEWKDNLCLPEESLEERVKQAYVNLAEQFQIGDWLCQEGQALLYELDIPIDVWESKA